MSAWRHGLTGGIQRTGERVPLVACWLMSVGGELVRSGRTTADVELGGEMFTVSMGGMITDGYGNALDAHERAEFERAFMG